MNLFDGIALFDEGKKCFTDFQLPDADLRLWEQFFAPGESDHYFRLLQETTPWAQHRRRIYEKWMPDPRLTAWYGIGSTNEWTPELLDIKARVEQESGIRFNSVLLNYYRDGQDSVSWHSDTLPSSGKHHAIASVTFGERRVFKVRHKRDKDFKVLDIPLTHGSFLLMGETMQDHYEHHVPKSSRKIGPRINLTFRVEK
ncbi:alpha-ketoglutarate-dependent dioxygenase AlkB family protein [Sediminibacterium ginsengisoli]|uniref:Alkylated DNA repair dioxygenase AlkB n=1 Tax=Sediminibacterium ginsengisoli TaxID=413434 RepID=A0A1T4R4V4_9BACT|nr:alpha-ketoglutarate-dependent dioxygenase AlkB [Sediminibacterium ginsengisoli]SKA10905.1 Alkylated DNA repair dioxygenase AlkB [Sediminibacterium ginsengisoli]